MTSARPIWTPCSRREAEGGGGSRHVITVLSYQLGADPEKGRRCHRADPLPRPSAAAAGMLEIAATASSSSSALAKGLAMLSSLRRRAPRVDARRDGHGARAAAHDGLSHGADAAGAGYLVTDPRAGATASGRRFIASTYLSEGYAELVAIARPYLESLVEETGESATLAVDVDGVAVCVDMVDSSAAAQARGGRGPHHRRHGKRARQDVSLPPSPTRSASASLDSPLERLTPETITEPEELRRVARGARQGVAFDIEERNAAPAPWPRPSGTRRQRHRQHRRHRADRAVRAGPAGDCVRRRQGRAASLLGVLRVSAASGAATAGLDLGPLGCRGLAARRAAHLDAGDYRTLEIAAYALPCGCVSAKI